VPEDIPSFRLDVDRNPYEDPRLYDYENYPPDLYVPPGTKIANRSALGSWGAYVVRDFDPAQPRGGTLIVQGTSAMCGIISLLPELDERGLNVKIIYAASPQLFAIQTKAYRQSVLPRRDWIESTVITTQARRLMHDWLYSKVSEEYAISADWDDHRRTGGRLNEVIGEAKRKIPTSAGCPLMFNRCNPARPRAGVTRCLRTAVMETTPVLRSSSQPTHSQGMVTVHAEVEEFSKPSEKIRSADPSSWMHHGVWASR